jgi:hypothetical protein
VPQRPASRSTTGANASITGSRMTMYEKP